MRIGSTHTSNTTSTSRKRASASGMNADFSSLLNTDAHAGVKAAASTSATSSVGNILSLQEISEEDSNQARTIAQGNDMLDTLEKLRMNLLMGRISANVIMELGQRLEIQRAQIHDPKLLEIMDDIELRVAVEKAKLEKARGA